MPMGKTAHTLYNPQEDISWLKCPPVFFDSVRRES